MVTGIKLAQLLCFIFNVLLAIAAIGLITVGTVMHINIDAYSHFIEGNLQPLSSVSIAAGVFLFLFALLGFWATIRKFYDALIVYGLCLLIIFVIELGVGIGSAVYNKNFESNLKDNMKESMDAFYTKSTHKKRWDNLQVDMRCCGLDGPSDWGEKKPLSCCIEVGERITIENIDECTGEKVLYSNGCYESVRKEVNKNTKILMATGFAIALLQIVGMVFAFLLVSKIKKQEPQAAQE